HDRTDGDPCRCSGVPVSIAIQPPHRLHAHRSATRMPVIIMGRRDFPPNDLKEFMSYVKANRLRPEEGHAGPSSISFVTCLLLNQILDVRPRLVPYDGAALAKEALVAGQVDYMCDQLMDAVSAVGANRVKPYAVSAPERSPAVPDVPTTSE